MIFAAIPAGVGVFIDANILIYYFAPDPQLEPACAQLLRRVENAEIQGFTSSHGVSDLLAARQTRPHMPTAGLSSAAILQLKELASLRDQGILSEDEFQAQKSRLLGK